MVIFRGEGSEKNRNVYVRRIVILYVNKLCNILTLHPFCVNVVLKHDEYFVGMGFTLTFAAEIFNKRKYEDIRHISNRYHAPRELCEYQSDEEGQRTDDIRHQGAPESD